MTSRIGVSGSLDGVARVWNLLDGRDLALLGHGGDEVTALTLSQNGSRLVTGTEGGRLRTWDSQTGRKIREYHGTSQPVRALAMAPDCRWFVSGSNDGVVRLWNSSKEEALREVCTGAGTISSMAITPDGKTIVIGSVDKTIRVLDLLGGTEAVLEGHHGPGPSPKRPIRSIGISPDGRHAISCAEGDRRAHLWDLAQGRVVNSIQSDVSHDGIEFARFSPDGRSLIGASSFGFLHIWQFPTCELSRVLGGALFEQMNTGGFQRIEETRASSQAPLMRLGRETHQADLTSFALAPDGRKALTGDLDGTVKCWEVNSTSDEADDGPEFGFFSIAVSSEAEQAIGDSEVSCGPIVLTLQGDALLKLEAPEGTSEVRALAVSPGGETVFAGMDSGFVFAWANEAQFGGDGELLGSVGYHHGAITFLAVSDDGHFLLSGSEDETLKIWDLENSFQELAEFPCGSPVTSAAITQDGQFVLSGMGNGEILVWDMDEPWEELEGLEGHGGTVKVLKIHSDRGEVTSICTRGRVITWDLETWTAKETWTLRRVLADADITPDARFVAGAQSGGGVLVWEKGKEGIVADFIGEAPMRAICISDDGKYLVAGEGSGRGHFLRFYRTAQDPGS